MFRSCPDAESVKVLSLPPFLDKAVHANHRITERFGLEGTLQIIQIHLPPPWAGTVFWCGDVYVVAVSSDRPLLLHFSPRSQALGPTAAPWASPAPPAIPATQTRPSLSGQDDVLT